MSYIIIVIICHGQIKIQISVQLVGIKFCWTGWSELVVKVHLGSSHAILGTLGGSDYNVVRRRFAPHTGRPFMICTSFDGYWSRLET